MKIGVVTVKPYGYRFWRAFEDIARSVAFAAREIGHEVEESSLPVVGAVNIIIGVNLLDMVAWEPPPGSILWNLEQIDSESKWLSENMQKRLNDPRFHVWDYSGVNVARALTLGIRSPIAVMPIGWTPALEDRRLEEIASELKKEDLAPLDAAMYGSINDRRLAVMRDPRWRDAGRNAIAFDYWGDSLRRLIVRARLIVNVHFYGASIFEGVRCSYLMANRMPFISEVSVDSARWPGVTFADYDSIPVVGTEILNDAKRRAIATEDAYTAIRNRPQSEYLRAALDLTL